MDLDKELKKWYGEDAEFHVGQKEAIEAALDGKRVLVVQKTGWGKSVVYFLAARALRKRREGFAIVISPLIALMTDQIRSASELGMTVRTINSSEDVSDDLEETFGMIEKNELDVLFVAPERLANAEFREILMRRGMAQKILLLVVDEAHCISDWGHDFRPDYRRIIEIIQVLPANVPVIATTATANDRVVDDIKAQLGDSLIIQRGSLTRDSIAIQTLEMSTEEEKLAWLAKNIDLFPGSGVIYCLTIRSCDLIVDWLNRNNIKKKAQAYYGKVADRKRIYDDFMDNKIQLLVSTVAFGMGVDKQDIRFIIHYNKPGNMTAYYQQIGRAGRNGEEALAVLLYGNEDDHINNYFIDTAFPTEDEMSSVLKTMDTLGEKTQGNEEFSMNDLLSEMNITRARLEKCLKYLEVEGAIYKSSSKPIRYSISVGKNWVPDIDRAERISMIRREELKKMNLFVRQSDCYMESVARELSDSSACPCGKCSNCTGKDLLPYGEVTQKDIQELDEFVRHKKLVRPSRKQWPDYKNIPDGYRCEDTNVLAGYGVMGWGRKISAQKYHDNQFGDEIVNAAYERLKDIVAENDITWITNIPSMRRPELVKSLAERLANKLGIQYRNALKKTAAGAEQKSLENSHKQMKNVMDTTDLTEGVNLEGNVLLLDDMVDSGWTFAVCGYLIRSETNSRWKVFPFALADSSRGGNN